MSLSLYLRMKGLIDEAIGMENQSCDKVLEEDEWKVLQQHYKVKGHDGKSALSMKWAYISIAKLGGFTDSKRTSMAVGRRFGKAGIHCKLKCQAIV
ncbi:MAG: hypothetical protein V5788_10235 [Shewanella sp.]